ncbi:hypothetical protein [Actinoplanes sp. NPDC049118]|uniref:hypothetical protein n=1 Tax=Actinoplanes sp. NPDC049118 TaxID=3155769 RepID=UPI0034024C24
MTSQDPYGPQEYPQFATGYAQYPPAQDHYAPAVSAPPAAHPADGYRAVAYPQEGAADFPEPVPYPQLTVAGVQGGAAAYAQGAAPVAEAPRHGGTADDDARPETSGLRLHGVHRQAGDQPHPDAYPPAGQTRTATYPSPSGPTRLGPFPPASGHPQPAAHPEGGPVGYAPARPFPPASGHPQPGANPEGGPVGYAPARPYAPAGGHPQPAAHPAGAPVGFAPAGATTRTDAYPGAGAAPSGGAYPPVAAYPTAPPWAATAQTSTAPAPAAPAQPVTEHGTLLVPYPDEMLNASRAHPPAVWPVTVFTLLFGVLGVISAGRRAADARRGRNSTAPYWITFLVSLAAASFIWFVVGSVVVKPLYNDIREGQRLAAVQDAVIHDGQLQKANITATEAECRAIAERGPDGMREYLCRLTLSDGRNATLTLTADSDGRWESQGTD